MTGYTGSGQRRGLQELGQTVGDGDSHMSAGRRLRRLARMLALCGVLGFPAFRWAPARPARSRRARRVGWLRAGISAS